MRTFGRWTTEGTRTVLAAFVVVVFVVVVTLAVIGGCTSDGDAVTEPSEKTTVPQTVIEASELPEIDGTTAGKDLAYLQGDGKGLLVMVDVVESAARDDALSDAEGCERLTADLTEVGSPDELAELSGPVSDEVLAAAFTSVRSTAVAMVGMCNGGDAGDGAQADDQTERAENATGLVRQRVRQLEEAE